MTCSTASALFLLDPSTPNVSFGATSDGLASKSIARFLSPARSSSGNQTVGNALSAMTLTRRAATVSTVHDSLGNLAKQLMQVTEAAVGVINYERTYRPEADWEEVAAQSSVTAFEANIEYTLKRLVSFLDLPVGWEHDDSQPGNPDHFAGAVAFLHRLPEVMNVPNAMISSDGSLGLFWQLPWLHAEIEFIDQKTFSLYSRELTGQLREVYLPTVEIRAIDAAWFERELPSIFDQTPALQLAA